jgi:segregation and condensation protein B
MTTHQLALLEAVLFAASKPLSLDELSKLTRINPDKLPGLLEILRQRYDGADHGIAIANLGGWRFVVRQEFAPRVSSFTKPDLPRGLLRVLSMIAYHEPVKQSDIVKIIGNRAYEYVKQLKESGFVAEEKHSRTKLLRTTPHFEAYFATKKEELKKALEATEKEGPKKAASVEGAGATQAPSSTP